MKVPEIFDQISSRMISDFEESKKTLQHRGLAGYSREEILRDFLKKYMPKSLEISKGVIVDSYGSVSKELDVIVFDAFKTPIFYSKGEIRVIPIECVYAVIEVKTHIGKTEVNEIFENMKSVRALKKRAYYSSSGSMIKTEHTLYGKTWYIWPVNYYVFGYDSIDLSQLAEYIDSIHTSENLPVESRIDTICVLNKGVICNYDANKDVVDALPGKDTSLSPRSVNNPLLLFYALIAHYLNQTALPFFRFSDYLEGISF